MKTRIRRAVRSGTALLLVLLICVSMLPVQVFASEGPGGGPASEEPDIGSAEAVPAPSSLPSYGPDGDAGTGYAETGQGGTTVPSGARRAARAARVAETVPGTDFEEFTVDGVIIAPGRKITDPYWGVGADSVSDVSYSDTTQRSTYVGSSIRLDRFSASADPVCDIVNNS